jgi:O-Antigen ligase
VLQQSADNPPLAARQGLDPHDAYVRLLCCTLAGYALLGKGFAYLGIAPLFIGEIALCLGLCVIFRSGCRLAMLATVPSLLVATLFALVMTAAVASVPAYGLDAIRDSAILLYSLFAFIVIALILEKPGRLRWILRVYGRFAWLYGMIGGVAFNLTAYCAIFLYDGGLYFPGTNIEMPNLRAGEAAVHLSGAAVFMLLGFRRVSLLWVMLLFVNILSVAVSRGGMLSILIPLGLAAVLGGQVRRLAPALLSASLLLAVTYAIGLEVQHVDSDMPNQRSIGAAQILENFESILGTSDALNLDDTKTWRLRWWQSIGDYTFNGPYFWTGKGYGLALAETDGFVGTEKDAPILRSPHNVHMTMLARSGVPGLALWILVQVAWFMALMNAQIVARRRGETQWANLFLWVACYGLAIVIDSSFDVAIEGPMVGIWYWSLFGLGIASIMAYRACLGTVGVVPLLLRSLSPEPHRSAHLPPNDGQ